MPDIKGASACPPREFSQAELLELVEASSDWIWETDSELRFSWVSDNYERITGVAAEKVLGRFRFDFLRHASQGSKSAAAHLEDLQARRPFRDFVYELKGGREDCRWISTTGYPRYDVNGAFLGYRGTGRRVAALPDELRLQGATAPDEGADEPRGDAATGESHLSDFERALNALRMGVVVVDADLNAQIINNAYRELSKMAPGDAPAGSPFRLLMETIRRHNDTYDIADDKWEAYVESRLAEIRAGDVAPREFRHTDGSTMVYSVTALSGGKRLLCYYDISEMKRREAELAEALERSRLAESVVNSVKDPIFVKDDNLRFVFVNEAFATLYGKKPAEMLGQSGSDFLPADVVATFEASERQVLETGERYEVEEDFEFDGIGRSRIVRKNRVSMESGKDYVACFVFDITEMKRRETEAEDARKHLADVLEALPAGVIIYDRDDKFVLANKELQDSLPGLKPIWRPGLSFGDAVTFGHDKGYFRSSGDPELDALYDSDRTAWLAGYLKRHELRNSVFERQHPDGRWFKVFDMRTDDGTFIGVRVDITEMKRRETEAEEARQHLANVLEALPAGVIIYDRDDNFVFANRVLHDSLPALKPIWKTGRSFREALELGHSLGYFRSSGEPEVDAIYDTDFNRWIEGMLTHYRQPHSVFERRNPDGRWFKVFDMRTDDGTFIGVRVDITEMKRRETEAEEARQRLADVLESMPAGVIIYDRDDKFVLANRKLKDAMPALSPFWVPGTPLREILEVARAAGYDRDSGDPELDELYDSDPEAWIEGFAARYHVRHSVSERRNQDGKWFQATNMRTDDGTFIGVRTDISEIKEREKALRKSMRKIELFRHVLDELPVAAYVKSADLAFEFVNKAWTDLSGISKEQASGHTDRDFFVGEGEGFAERDLDVLRTGVTNETEETLTHIDGTSRQLIAKKSRLIASDGSVHLIGSSTDITEMKSREVRLQESLRENEIFRSLIDNVPVAIYAKRDDLKLFYVNKYWTQLTGVPSEEAVGKTDFEVSGENGLAFMESDRAILRTGQSQEIEETVEQADGSIRYQMARKGSLVASDGSLYLLGSTIDVTDQKEREKLLQEAQRRAVLADRAKSEFLANMSHEIRTPMNGVLGMAELLAKSNLDPKQKTFTDIIVKSGNALLTIINDILDFSKIDAGQLMLDPAPFKLAEAIEDVATLISTRAKEKDLELIVRIEPGLGDIYIGDVGRLRQIITNLIGNAVKFTDSGHVLVDVSGVPAGADTRLRISVTDTGIGIPADKLGTVFEKFSQVDASSTRRHEGTGLGLAITSRLVALMGGEIGVDSTEGMGSTFWFMVTLPNAGHSGRRKVTPFDVTGARILVVDDNPVNRAILIEQMASWTFDACAAESGIEGLKVLMAADACGLSVDCIVLDYQMPGMTGAEMARVLRATERVAATPIVMLTSVDQSLSNSSYRDLSIDAQLIKPTRSSVLLETLVSTIQKHRSHRAGPSTQDSRVSVGVPLLGPDATIDAVQPAPAARRRDRSADSGNRRIDILVAEDNEVNQLVFSQILGETDYSFEIVSNGRLALKAFGDMNPGMILMDVSMPEMSGLEATVAIRSAEAGTDRHVPIIGVTAHALKGDRERCLEVGMDDYLPKPISPKTLIEKVERWSRQEDRESRSAG